MVMTQSLIIREIDLFDRLNKARALHSTDQASLEAGMYNFVLWTAIILFNCVPIKSYETLSARSLRHEVVHPNKICLDGNCQFARLSMSTSHSQEYKFELVRNDELISDDYFEQIDDVVIVSPGLDGRSTVSEETDCYYYQSRESGVMAAVSDCEDKLEGLFTLRNESFILQFDHDLGYHCIFRYHDLPQTDWIGDSLIDLTVAKEYADKHLTRPVPVGRGVNVDPTPEAKYLEVLYVIDKAMYVTSMYESMNRTRKFIKEIVNSVAAKYRNGKDSLDPMNFHIVLKGILVWSEKDPLAGNPNIQYHLIDFLKYNFETLHPTIGQDHAVLLTGRKFPDTPTILGIALRSSVCMRPELAAVMAVYHSDKGHTPVSLGDTIAHETGHSLGFWDERYRRNWNCQGAQNYKTCLDGCDTDDCIMRSCSNPQKTTSSNKWSTCTHETAKSRWKDGKYFCLGNRPFREKSVEAISICGNGVIEYGEECDCPMNDLSCSIHCCNVNDCTLKAEAKCSSGLCCHGCQIRKKGEKCREKVDETCDVEDTCDGVAEICHDNYATNKTSCGGSNDMWCRMGRCSSKCFKNCFGHGNCRAVGDGHECKCSGLYYGKFCQFRFGITWHIVLGLVLGGISCTMTLIVFALQDRYFIKDQVY